MPKGFFTTTATLVKRSIQYQDIQLTLLLNLAMNILLFKYYSTKTLSITFKNVELAITIAILSHFIECRGANIFTGRNFFSSKISIFCFAVVGIVLFHIWVFVGLPPVCRVLLTRNKLENVERQFKQDLVSNPSSILHFTLFFGQCLSLSFCALQ